MKKIFKSLINLVVFTGIIGMLTGCGATEDGTVNIGYFNNVTHAQALYMKASGDLEEKLGGDTSVAWTAFNAGPAEVEALLAGSIDIGYIGPVPAVTACAKSNGDIVIISSATKGGSVLIVRDGADINSVADLAGKNIAIPQIGNTQHLCLLKLLSDNNLTPTYAGGDVNIIAVANADVANVMDRGDIDAALVPEPWGSTLLAGGARLLLNYDEIYAEGKYDVAVVVARKDFIEAHPDIVSKFMEVHNAETAKINSNLEESVQIINDEINAATGKSLTKGILDESFSRILVDTTVDKVSVLGLAEVSQQQDIISEVPSEDILFTTIN